MPSCPIHAVNIIGLYPNGCFVGGYTFYLIVWDYGGSVPIYGLASDGWHTSI